MSMEDPAMWSEEPIPEHDLNRVDVAAKKVVCNCEERFDTLDALAEHCGIPPEMVALLRHIRKEGL